ncbi:hypothetical protein [uncultured Thiodictyon sp.]|nr:hypothetical protein [uncultured Thiodictyon sp.]
MNMCADLDVERLTWESCMNRHPVHTKLVAHPRLFFNDLGHLLGIVPAK